MKLDQQFWVTFAPTLLAINSATVNFMFAQHRTSSLLAS
jgi:hypothetical protein